MLRFVEEKIDSYRFHFGWIDIFFVLTKPDIPAYYRLTPENISSAGEPFEYVDADSVDLALLEWTIFTETNAQRQRLGLPPLAFDWKLQKGAKLHSEEMLELDYFDHVSPVAKNKTVKMRLRHAGIKQGSGGENIAIHPINKKQEIVFRSPEETASLSKYAWRNEGSRYTYKEFAVDLVQRWLNSPPHRRNILSKRFKYLGVGCVFSTHKDIDVFYVTQNFSSTNY